MQHPRKSPKPRDFDSRAQHCNTCTASSEIKFANFSRTRRLLCSISGFSLRRRSVDCYESRPNRVVVSAHHFIWSFFLLSFFFSFGDGVGRFFDAWELQQHNKTSSSANKQRLKSGTLAMESSRSAAAILLVFFLGEVSLIK